MTNSADSDQLAPTLFEKAGHIRDQQDQGFNAKSIYHDVLFKIVFLFSDSHGKPDDKITPPEMNKTNDTKGSCFSEQEPVIADQLFIANK